MAEATEKALRFLPPNSKSGLREPERGNSSRSRLRREVLNEERRWRSAYAVHILDVYDHYRCRAWPVKNKMGGGEPVFSGHIDTDDNWLARYPVPIID